MRKGIIIFFMLITASYAHAQHCPYDGMHLIAITVIDNSGKPLTNSNVIFYLQEIENPMADSCSYTKGLVRKELLSSDDFIAATNEMYNNGYNTKLLKRLHKAGIFEQANKLISINQTENTCILIGKSKTVYTNYMYRQRKYEIVYTINGNTVHTPLPENCIYAACTARKELDNFKPFFLQIR